MPNAFAFSKIFVAVLAASQLIGAAQAASVIINRSQSEAVVISESATASYYGAFTVDSSWHDGYGGIANPQYLVSNTFTLEQNATITQPALIDGDISGQNNAYFGVFIGRFGQVDQLLIKGKIDTSVGIYNEGTIGKVLTNPGTDTVIEDYAIVVTGKIDTSVFGKATTIEEPNAIQNTWAGVIGGSVLIDESSAVKTDKDGHELLNAGSIYGNIVVKSSEDHEILNRKPAGGKASGLITGEIVNKAGGVLSVYNEGSILSGVKNEGTGSVRIVNQNLIAGKELIANSLYNVPYSAIEANGLKYQSMKDSGTSPSVDIAGSIKLTGNVLNYGAIKAESAEIHNLKQAAASASLTVTGALSLTGTTENLGSIHAVSAEIFNLTQSAESASLSVTGALTLSGAAQNSGSIKAKSASVSNLTQSGSAALLAVTDKLTLSGDTVNFGTIQAGSAEISNLTQSSESALLSVTGALTLSGAAQNSGSIKAKSASVSNLTQLGSAALLAVTDKLTLSGDTVNFGTIQAGSAEVRYLRQSVSSRLTVDGALTVTGSAENHGSIEAASAEISGLTQSGDKAELSVAGGLLFNHTSSMLLNGTASAGTVTVAEGTAVSAGSVGVGAANAGHNLTAAQSLTVNGILHAAGAVDIGSGTSLAVAEGAKMTASVHSPVTVAGTLTVADSIAVGAGATGTKGFISESSSFTAEGSALITAKDFTEQGADSTVAFEGASNGAFTALTLNGGSFEVKDSAKVTADTLALSSAALAVEGSALIRTRSLTAGSASSLTVAETLAVGGDTAAGIALANNLVVNGTLSAGTLAVSGKAAVFEEGAEARIGSLTAADGATVLVENGASLKVTDADGSVRIADGSQLAVEGDLSVGSASAASAVSVEAQSFVLEGANAVVAGLLTVNNPDAVLEIKNGSTLQAANLSLLAGNLKVSDGLLVLSDAASILTVAEGTGLTVAGDVTLTDALPLAAGVMALADDGEENTAAAASGLVSLQSSADIAGSLSSRNITVSGDTTKTLTVTKTGAVHGASLTLNNRNAVVTFEQGSDSVLTGNLILEAGKLVIEKGADLELTGADSIVEVDKGARLEVGDMVLVSESAMPESASGLRANAAEITIAGELDARSLIVNRPESHVTFKSGAWGYIESLNLQTGTLAVERGALLEMGRPSSDRRAALGIDAENEAVLDHNDHKALVVNQARVAVGTVDASLLNPGDVYFAGDSHFVIDTKDDLGVTGLLHSDHEGSVLTIAPGAKLTVVSAAMGRHLIAKGFTVSDADGAGVANWDANLRVLNLNEEGLTLQVQVADDGDVILDVPVPDSVDEEMSAPGIIDSIIEGDNFELRDPESDAEDIKFITSVVEPGIFTEGTETGVDVTESAHYYNSVIEFGAASGFRAYAIDQVQTMADIRDAFLSRDPSPDRNVWGHLVARRSGMNALFSAGSMKGGYRANTEGLVLGADYYATDTARAGVSFHYLKGNLRSHGDYELTKTRSHIVGLSLYGKKKFGQAAVQSQVSWSYGSARARQDFNDLIGRNYDISGRMKTNSLLAGVRAEYAFDLGIATLSPHAGVRYIGNHYAAFDTKINGQGAFRNSSKNVNLLQTPVGLSVKAGVDTASVKWTGFADASYVPQIGRKSVTGTVSAKHFDASDDYAQSVAGDGYVNVALGVTALKGAHSFGVTYNGNFGSKNYRSNGLMARYNYRF